MGSAGSRRKTPSSARGARRQPPTRRGRRGSAGSSRLTERLRATSVSKGEAGSGTSGIRAWVASSTLAFVPARVVLATRPRNGKGRWRMQH